MNVKQHFKHIKLLALDIDGVLTDGRVICMENGDQVRTMNIKDGYALQHAVKSGLDILIISGGNSKGARMRLEALGISNILMGVSDKLPVLEDFCMRHFILPQHVAYMGDDIPDLPCMQWCGLPACPADAAQEIRAISSFISLKNGGNGAVRDVLEQILKSQDKWLGHNAFSW